MVDETGPLQGSFYRECEHNLVTNELIAQPALKRFPTICASTYHVSRVSQAHRDAARQLMPVPEHDMDALADQALAYMIPTINEGTSVLNFAYELREMKMLDPRNSVKRVRYGATSLKLLSDPKTREGFVKDTTRRLAGAHLAAEFGIVPFVKDVVGIYDTLQGLAAKLDRLKAHARKTNTRHYRRVLPYASGKFWKSHHRESQEILLPPGSGLTGDFVSPAFGYPDRNTGETVLINKGWILRPTYHATLRYSYDLPKFDNSLEEQIAVKSEALGIRLDPSIPWNALRFSFLVDWVVDVSGFLSNLAKDTYHIETKVVDFCHSLSWHYEATASVYERWDSPGWEATMPPLPDDFHPLDPLPVWKGTERHYVRYRGHPDSNTTVTKRLNLRKAALAGSLLIVNARSLRRGRAAYMRVLPELIRHGK